MRWWSIFHERDRLERELDAELREHVDRLIADHVARGVPPAEARRQAALEFGRLEQIKDACRDERTLHLLDETSQDVRFAARMLRRQPGFTLAVVCSLALGLGASAAIFSIVNAALLRPLPYRDAHRLVQVVETIPAEDSATGAPERTASMNMSEFVEWRARASTVSHAAARHAVAMTFVTRDGAVRLAGARVSHAMFPMLGVEPALGRLFDAAAETPGSDRVVLLGHAAWQTYFGGDPQVVGRPIELDGVPYAVAGVMPRGFRLFPDAQAAFWLPLVITPESGGFQRLEVVARLGDQVSVAAAAAEAGTIFRALRGYEPGEAGPPIEVVSWQDELVATIRPALVVFAGAVSLVLMIACLSVVNLFLARSIARRQELAVRIALGAGRSRIVRQFLAEALLLTTVSATAALGIAVAGIRVLKAFGQPLPRADLARLDAAGRPIPMLDELAVDGSVVLFTVLLALAAGVFFAMAPALRAWRSARIHQGGTGNDSRGTGPLSSRNLLVLAQVSLTVVLLVSAGLLIRSFVALTRVDAGYDASSVLTFQTVPGAFGPAAQDPGARTFLEDLIERLEGLPGTRVAAFTSALPMVQSSFALNLGSAPGTAGAPTRGGQAFVVSRDYFRVLRMPLVAGRTFAREDRQGHTRAFVINEALAQYFGGVAAVGMPLVAWGLPGEVVGIVADVRQVALDRPPEPQLFMDIRQLPAGWPFGFHDGVYVALRTEALAAAVVPMIRQVARELDPAMPIDAIATMSDIVANSVTRPRMDAALMGMFAAVSLLLATAGVYGVIAYFVTEQTRDIGIRVAFGAQRRQVLAMVFRRVGAITAAGLLVGIAGAFGATRYLEGMLYGVTPLDAVTFAGVVLITAAAGGAAAWVPARRATAVDPVAALRYE